VIIPYGTDRPLRRTPLVTWALMALNILVYVAFFGVARASGDPDRYDQLLDLLAHDPSHIRPWTLLGHMFAHGDFLHLGGNMVALAVFGPNVEDRLGRVGYTLFYLGTGVIAALVHALLDPHSAVGASAAIAGVTGAYIILFPLTTVRVFYFFILIGVASVPAWIVIGISIAKDIVLTGLNLSGNIATIAHLGGYFSGIALALALLASRKLTPEPYDVFTMLRQAKRRAEMRRAGEIIQQRSARVQTDAPIDPQAAALAEAKRALGALLATPEPDAAQLESAHAAVLARTSGPGAPASLGAQAQQALANRLFADGRHAGAADAYQSFLAAHSADPGAPRVRLMLALTCARYLGQPDRARRVLATITAPPTDADERALLESLRTEVGLPAQG
jgi:membrane associated rhomboid family serine protease